MLPGERAERSGLRRLGVRCGLRFPRTQSPAPAAPMVSKDFKRFMNHRAPANSRYKPTCYEHAANCYTHAFLIVPAIVGSALLHRLSDDRWESITAWIYGFGLCTLFIVSTVFHIVTWKKSHLRTVEHCFHMCDRMVIYFFIAASYAPWLNLRELGPLASHMRWFIWLMAAGGTIYVFLYHEKITRRACKNWRGEVSSTAWGSYSSRATESSLSLTPYGTSSSPSPPPCTITQSGNTFTRVHPPT
ncbi:monocyte to macrophage differentiation factor isoform X2 [Spea bombifrons]|uniref:monocyte to macrophage differentiation factor isoform X2 n=1 Tax=Spea bombifrons TaxID=233779 RepID=UPI00234A6921|nr:monocyte to macrophage differentiation factor isoform X2 [Spea bombifrons]